MPNLIYTNVEFKYDLPPDSVAETELRLAGVSTNARKLYARLCAGRWYDRGSDHTPLAMLELLAARLVKCAARYPEMRSSYVPHDALTVNHEVIVNASECDPKYDIEFRGHQKLIAESIAQLELRMKRFREFQIAHRVIC